VIDDDFRAAIFADPASDAERLVYADWLIQRGDPRGELIHVQCALTRGPDPALAEREAELLDRHTGEWLGEWHLLAEHWTFRRGFLDELAIAPAELLARADAASRELRHLRALACRWRGGREPERGDAIARIAALPALAGLERLVVSAHHVGPAGIRALGQLSRLRELTLDDTGTGDPGIAELVASGFAALESLGLISNRVTDAGAMALARWPQLARLRELDLSSIDVYHPTCNQIGDLGAQAIASAARQLALLDLGENAAIGDGAARALAAMPQLATLSRLTLEFSAIGSRGARDLATSPHLARLEHLDLGHTAIDDEAVPDLLAMPQLRSLPLNGTRITVAGIEQLLAPSCRLVETDLRFGEHLVIPRALKRRLRARFPKVTFVDDPHIEIHLDSEIVAEIRLDGVQDSFPWYEGTLTPCPELEPFRRFVDAYRAADLELDYCPHHPHEGPYEDTDLARYVAQLAALREQIAASAIDPAAADDTWLAPWIGASLDELDAYLRFLDWRRWRAVTCDGTVIDGIPLPPRLDLEGGRFAYRP